MGPARAPVRARSLRTVSMFRALLPGPGRARDLGRAAGIPSRWVYPYLKPWIRRGFVRRRWTPLGAEYYLSPLGSGFAREIAAFLAGDLVLSELLRRLYAKGLRHRIYRDIVSALYRLVRDKPDVAYLRGPSPEWVAGLLLEVIEEKYTIDEVLEALRRLHEAGVIIVSRPTPRIRSFAVAFRYEFVRGLGVPSRPPRLRPAPPPF